MSYIVIFRISQDRRIKIGKLGLIFFRKGYYLYVGSSPKNLIIKRIERHKRKKKKLHWHIDYFSSQRKVKFIGYRIFKIEECNLARKLSNKFPSLDRFGSSDCSCLSHLFYSQTLKRLYNYIN